MMTTEEVAVMTASFKDASNVQRLRFLFAVQTPMAKALAEKPLLGAIQSWNEVLVQTCLEAGANSNSMLLARTALRYVTAKAIIELVRILIEARADVNAPRQMIVERPPSKQQLRTAISSSLRKKHRLVPAAVSHFAQTAAL
jgi:hypothetical protein